MLKIWEKKESEVFVKEFDLFRCFILIEPISTRDLRTVEAYSFDLGFPMNSLMRDFRLNLDHRPLDIP